MLVLLGIVITIPILTRLIARKHGWSPWVHNYRGEARGFYHLGYITSQWEVIRPVQPCSSPRAAGRGSAPGPLAYVCCSPVVPWAESIDRLIIAWFTFLHVPTVYDC